jgi:stage II sporulation protein AB (anti-sigma F factor)
MSHGAARILSLDTSYEAVPESVGKARRAVAGLAELDGAGEEDLERIRLAVSEALSNAVIHAYGHGNPGMVTLTAAVIDTELTVIVGDDGCGFGGAPESQGLGVGLTVIAELCDSLSMIARSSGGTQMEMRFRLAHGQGAGAELDSDRKRRERGAGDAAVRGARHTSAR